MVTEQRWTPILVVAVVSLLAFLGLGELLLRYLDASLDGPITRIGWGWARLAIVVAWAAAFADWVGRRRRRRYLRRR